MYIVYTIRQPCGHIWSTIDPNVAQKASKSGCIVYARGKRL